MLTNRGKRLITSFTLWMKTGSPVANSSRRNCKERVGEPEVLHSSTGDHRMTVKNGPLPKGWREVQLGEFMEFKNGLNTRKENYGSGVKFVNVMDVFSHNHLYANDVIGSVQVTKKQLVDYSVKYGDVLFNRTSETFEEIAMSSVYLDKKEIIFGGFVIRGRQKSNILIPEYSAYCFQAHTVRRELIRRGQGAVRANIGQKDLSKIPMVIPPVNEQKAIASLLEKWDTAIEKTEALIEAKEKRFKWLLKTLISDQQDNPEWEKMKLGEICTFEYGKPLKEQDRIGDQYPVFGSNGIVGRHNEYLVAGPFIVVGRKGSAGTVSYSMSNGFPIDTTFYINLQSGEIHLRFLYYLLLLVELDKISAQSGVPGLNRNDAYKISISIPSPIEQREITRALDVASRETDLLNQLAEQYRIQKHGLMQKLLTGKWRIKPNTKARM